jgi:hypothetical protein
MFDLHGFNQSRLERAGVGAIENLGLCTYSDEERFFSYRRTTRQGGQRFGVQLSAIGLTPPPST